MAVMAGAGATGNVGGGAGGGGGGGGKIMILCNTVTSLGTLDDSGGNAGTGSAGAGTGYCWYIMELQVVMVFLHIHCINWYLVIQRVKEDNMATRNILDYQGNIIGELTLPDDATDIQWANALAAYANLLLFLPHNKWQNKKLMTLVILVKIL